MNYKRPEKLYLFETQRGLGVALENSQLVIASAKGIISSVPHVIDSRYSVGLKAFAIAFTQSEVIATTKAVLQQCSVDNCSKRTASKLMKNLPNSARRKYEREDSRIVASYQIALSTPAAILFTHLSMLIVQQSKDILEFVWVNVKLGLAKKDEEEKEIRSSKTRAATNSLVKKTKINFWSFFQAIVFGTVGYSVGTLISPGVGTFIGGIIGENIPYILNPKE